MPTRTYDNPDHPNATTPDGVPCDALPPLADWLDSVHQLNQRQQREAVRKIIPALTAQPPADQRAWLAAIAEAGIYSAGYLARLVRRATPDRDDEEDQGGEFQVPGSLWSYTPGEGVWSDQGRQLLTWCPVVTENLISYRDDGRVFGQQVTITVGEHTATVPMDEVESGRVWWEALPSATGTADRKVRDQLTNIIRDQAARLPETVAHPRWRDDRLELPPAACLPNGYLEQGGTWHGWVELVRRSMDAPKIALVMSLAVAGLYVQPTRRQSYVVHLKGISSRGKSTAAMMAAGIFGCPDENAVVTNWNASAKSVPAWLRDLRVLTGVRDELQSANMRPAEVQSLMFQITQGAQRHVSSRSGMYRAPAAGWHGALISTGNVSILGMTDNPAMFARVIEIDTPFTTSAEQSDALKEMAAEHYGWGLPAVVERGLPPAEWLQWCAKARTALEVPSGDLLGRAGHHLAGGVAAARLLEEITGAEGLQECVFHAAKDALGGIADDLTYKGGSLTTRFLQALADKIASEPALFPTEAEYRAAKQSEFGGPKIWGWDWTDHDGPGDVALLPSGLKKLAQESEITDTLIVLKELAREGKLYRNQSSRHLTKQIKVAGKKERAYVIGGLAEVADDEPVPTAGTHTGTHTGTHQKNGSDLRGTHSTHIPAPEGVCSEGATDTPPASGSMDWDALIADCAGDPDRLGDVWALAQVYAPHDRALIERIEREGRAARARKNPPHSTGEGLDHGRRGHHTGDGVSGREKANQGRFASSPKGYRLDTATAAPVNDPSEFDAWQAWLRKAEIELDEQTARRALAAWHAATGGTRWVSYPGEVGLAIFYRHLARHRNKARPDRCESDLAQSVTTDPAVKHHFDYVNPEIVPEIGQKFVGMDVCAQYLGAASSVVVGRGEPQEITASRRPIRLESVVTYPGYVELAEDLQSGHPAFSKIEAGTILPMPIVRYLLDRKDSTITASRVIFWQDKGQDLATHAKVLRQARYATMGSDDPAQQVAHRAVKAVYSAFYGGMMRSETHNRTGTMRRDWSDQLVGLAWANAFRALDKADAPAMGMCRDTAWWITGEDAAAPGGLVVSDQPGKWKVEKWGEVTDEIVTAHASGSAYLVRDAINSANRTRMEADQ